MHSLIPRPPHSLLWEEVWNKVAYEQREGVQILGLAPQAWSGQSNRRAAFVGNNAAIVPLQACYEIHYQTLSNL